MSNHHPLKKLGEVAQIEMGQSPASDYVHDDLSKGTPFLQGCAEFGATNPIPKKSCSGLAKVGLAGSSLISVRAPVGAINKADQNYVIGRGLAAVSSKEGTSQAYLNFALEWAAKSLHRVAQGSTFEAIGNKELRNLEIPVPTHLAEQKGIAEVLSALDEQIEATEALVAKFEATRTGLVRDLLAEVKDSAKKPLKELAIVGSGITLGREFSGQGTAEYPYLRVANVQDGRLELNEVKTIRIPVANAEMVMLQPGDVLMNEGGDFDKLGRGAVWEGQIRNCLHQNHVFRVRCDQKKLLPRFLALWAASDFGKRFFILASKQSTNLASINSTQLKGFPVLTPSVDKQREILDAVEAMDAIQAQNKAEVAKLRLKKQGLMRDLLTGAVSVSGVN